MKKIYLVLFAIPVLAFSLLYFSVWWFIAGMGAMMLFIAYRFYAEKIGAAETVKELLQTELEDLHMRLENAVVKEQKTSKEADDMRQVKQQLLSVISHEVRTPLNGIFGMTLLLADTALTADQQDYNNTIRTCGEGLLTTINSLLANDVLDFSKQQQEGNKLEYQNFDLRNSIEEVLGLFAEKAAKSGIELVYSIDRGIPVQIIGDNKRLRQLLMNLVENAVKFTRKGEVFIGVHYQPSGTPGHIPELRFEIRDTGIGIAKSRLVNLFKGIPAREISKDKMGETEGLGLVICHKLAELMGGKISVSSVEGEGSTFTFNMPLTPSLHPTRDQANTMLTALEGKNILIVEDNATQRGVLLSQLRDWKAVPVTAASGEQAMGILSAQQFDVVIMDAGMTDASGGELAQAIKNLYPNLPIILMNSQGNTLGDQASGLFASVLIKPLRQFMLKDHLIKLFTDTPDKAEAINKLSDEFAKHYPLSILVAEDNPVNQKIATKILGMLGYTISLAHNGKEALEMVGTSKYDLILMDVQMPEMDGLEATRMIRTCLEIQPVIVAMTANVMQGDRDACMQAGMDDYMSKPIDLKELLGKLEKWAVQIKVGG